MDPRTRGQASREGSPARGKPAGLAPPDRPRRRVTGALALALYAVWTLFCLRPVWRTFADHLAPGPGDPVLILYVLKWDMRQILAGLPALWDANFFFPVRGALALGDHMLGPALALVLLSPLLPGAIAGYNLLLAASFALTALTAFHVLGRGGRSPAAALLGGAIFAFSPFRFSHLEHLQLLLAPWIPLVLWSWDRLLVERTPRRAALFLVFYILHLGGGGYLGLMIHVPLLALAASRWPLLRREALTPRSLRVLAAAVVLAAAAALAAFLPYARLASRLHLGRTPGEIAAGGATLASYLTPAAANVYSGWGLLPSPRQEGSLFAGFLPTLLAVAGLALLIGSRRRAGLQPPPAGGAPAAAVDAGWERGVAIASLACLLLTFPAIYLPLARLVPGLAGMRAPARFYVFVSLGVAVLAARGIDGLLGRLRGGRARTLAAAALALLLVAELTPRPPRWMRLPTGAEVPAVYRWIALRPEVRALVELPLRPGWRETEYMYYSTFHWKPIANGFSGYVPPTHRSRRVKALPDEAGLARWRRLGITHLVVHPGRLAEVRDLHPQGTTALAGWERRHLGKGVALVYADPAARVYQISQRGSPARVSSRPQLVDGRQSARSIGSPGSPARRPAPDVRTARAGGSRAGRCGWATSS